MKTRKYIALLFTEHSKVHDFMAHFGDYTFDRFRHEYLVSYPTVDYYYVLCESTLDAVMSRFCASHLSCIMFADDGMYDGEALMYLQTRIREVVSD